MSVAFAIEPKRTLVNDVFKAIVELCDDSNIGISHYAFEFLHDLKDNMENNSQEIDMLFNKAYNTLQDLLMAPESEKTVLKNQFLSLGKDMNTLCA